MKRVSFGWTLLALVLAAGTAGAASVGLGGFGGVSIPIVQDDTGRGTVFGVRAPVSLLPLLSVEPFFASSSMGDKDQRVAGLTYTRDGGTVSAFGLNAMLGGAALPGFKFFPYVGLGSYTLKREG